MPTASIPWIKLYTALLDDARLSRLAERVCWRYVQLLLLAGECDAEGYLVDNERALNAGDLAWRLRAKVEAVQADLQALMAAGLLEEQANTYLLVDFSECRGVRKPKSGAPGGRQNSARER